MCGCVGGWWVGFGLGFESHKLGCAHTRARVIPHVHKKARARAQKSGPPPAILESVRASPVTSPDVTVTSPRRLCSQFDPAVTSLKLASAIRTDRTVLAVTSEKGSQRESPVVSRSQHTQNFGVWVWVSGAKSSPNPGRSRPERTAILVWTVAMGA